MRGYRRHWRSRVPEAREVREAKEAREVREETKEAIPMTVEAQLSDEPLENWGARGM